MAKHDYTAEEEALRKSLTKEDLETMQKTYPFRNARNAKIREIAQRDVSYHVLAKISGLHQQYIWRIVNVLPTIKRGLLSESDLIKMQAALDTFNKEIKAILNGKN